MAETVYLLCAVASLACMVLLLRGYLRRRGGRARFLLWSGLCFGGLSANNILLFMDKVVFPDYNLSIARSLAALAGLALLLFGLVWDSE